MTHKNRKRKKGRDTMKKLMATMALTLMFLMAFSVRPVHAAELTPELYASATNTDPAPTVYTATIVFYKNGGSGSMANLSVSSDASGAQTLTKNAFKRKGFTFTGWNTKANGKGTSYNDKANAKQFATKMNNGKKISLYAQWKLKTPKIKSVKKSTPVTIKVKFGKMDGVSGYEFQYSTNKNFKKGNKKLTAKKKDTSAELTETTPGKTHYVRMRSYYTKGGKTTRSDWSSRKSIKLPKASTISNTKASTAIEADVTLTGSGTGYHAKLVLCTPNSAVSFGIQYDAFAAAPYTGRSMALIENVAHNGPGGQSYVRPGNIELARGKKHHLMLTIDKNGNGGVYVNYKKIGNFSNPSLANQAVEIRVEGSARLNGDKVTATFENIRLIKGGKYDPNRPLATIDFTTCKSIKTKISKNGSKIVFNGNISGLPAGGDWDNMYQSVSGIRQFY